MANIKNMEMAPAILADSRLSVSKGFLGFGTKAVYNVTGSPVMAKTIEYSPENGERLRSIVEGPRQQLQSQLDSFKGQPTVNGNYMLEVCTSADGEFAALLLLHYVQMNYEPVSSVLILEGAEAQAAKRAFA